MKKQKYALKKPHPKIGVGKLKLNKCNIHSNVILDITGNITIEDHAEIQNDVRIFTHTHKWNHSKKLRKDIQKIIKNDLIIGEDVFIGVRAIILGGVTKIGKGAVIGAGSIVTKNIPDYEVWAGNPAKKINERK